MSEHEHVIACGLYQQPHRISNLSGVREEFFQDKETRALFVMARAYHDKYGGKNVLDFALARAKLEQSKNKKAIMLLALLGEYEEMEPVTDPEFRDSMEGLVRLHQEEVLRKRGTAGLAAIVEGDFEEAKRSYRQALLEVEDSNLDDDAPIDIRSALEVEAERRRIDAPRDDDVLHFDIGFPRLMRAVKFRPRELTILGGYSADGKTQVSKAIAYNANSNGANVMFVALEMTKKEVKTLFIAQHAATLDRRGVPWVDALDGTLNAGQKKLWHKALDDFEIREHGDDMEFESEAGSLVIWAPTRQIHQGDWAGRLRAAKQENGIQIAVKDYTELVKPRPKQGHGNYRLDLKDMIEEDKALARELDLWVIDNHQISRKGREDAEKREPAHYIMRDLGESSGLERAADHIIWVFSDHDLKDDRRAKVGIAKSRKGRQIVHGIYVLADYEKALVAALSDADL